MTFTRTSSGLSNYHLFYGVDAVIFLEGGKSLNREQLASKEFNTNTDDIRYWKELFKHYKPNLSCKFFSLGSKESVKNFARNIIENEINNCVAAMDRDFDNLSNTLLDETKVIYTFGYSWENDAWNPETLVKSYALITGTCDTQLEETKEKVISLYGAFDHKIRRAVFADALLLLNNHSVFSRDSYIRYISIENSAPPELKLTEIRKSLSTARTKVERRVENTLGFEVDPPKDCFGHLYAEYGYRLFCYLLHKAQVFSKIPKTYAESIVVTSFIELLKDGIFPDIHKHYEKGFSNIKLY